MQCVVTLGDLRGALSVDKGWGAAFKSFPMVHSV